LSLQEAHSAAEEQVSSNLKAEIGISFHLQGHLRNKDRWQPKREVEITRSGPTIENSDSSLAGYGLLEGGRDSIVLDDRAMEQASIAKLLRPFLRSELSLKQLESISTYINILLRWNARINLTSVRRPEQIVQRHFGESIFAAQHIFPDPSSASPLRAKASGTAALPMASVGGQDFSSGAAAVVDVGSGAGFPGIPIKIWAPAVHLNLIESNHKKATFLKELVRALGLTAAAVLQGRAEDFPAESADVVTVRAVEQFESILPTAARLTTRGAILVLLIGAGQIETAKFILKNFDWLRQLTVPLSDNRVLLMGKKE